MVNAARIGGSVPSYRHSLALLGQYLNKQHGSRAVIAEVESGFLLICFPHDRWMKPTTISVHHTDLLELTGEFAGTTGGRNGVLIKGGDQHDKKHPVCPTGYDAFLRAVGDRLDRRGCLGVTICDSGDRIYVSYWVDRATFVIREGHREPISTVQLEIYDAASAKKLLQVAVEQDAAQMRRYQQGLKINPNDHISMLGAVFLLEEEGHYHEAEALLQRIVNAVPEHPEAHYHVARLALVRGDKRTALTAAKKAIALQGDDPSVLDLYGRVLLATGKKNDAVAALQSAATLDPGNGIHHLHLARAYQAAGRTDEAAAEMALSMPQVAPAAWDTVQGEITIDTIEVRPVDEAPADLPGVAQLPAESALLPSIADRESPLQNMPVPTMTTTFEPSLSAWPPVSTSPDQAAVRPPSEGRPPSIPVAANPARQSAPLVDAEEPFLTLEQRLHLARQAPFQPAAPRSDAMRGGTQYEPAGDDRLSPVSQAPPPDRPTTPPADRTRMGREMPVTPVTPASQRHTAPAQPERAPDTRPPSAPTGYSSSPAPTSELAEAQHQPSPSPARPPSGRLDESSEEAIAIAADVLSMQRALAVEPNRADLHRKLGFLLARQGKTAEAAAEFRKALQASRTSL